MGNSHTKEERAGPHHQGPGPEPGGGSLVGSGRHGEFPATRRSSRPDLGPLGIAIAGVPGSRQPDAPFERRETKQEREARKLEKERVARVKERERSMKEEHVDGGYLVTMGVYTASEDFNKPAVRQLQIERKIAPFWRGLDDFKDTWAEHQIIAAARGLEIPPADQVPEHLIPAPRPPHHSPQASSSNLNNLTVPMGSRTLSASSDRNTSQRGSVIPSPTSTTMSKATSPLKQPKKALAAALNLSRNSSQAEIAPQEIGLPHDPFVNGQALEVFLYKEGEECPLCLMYYPPYLNRTRCCCQVICSECFVQIKRPEPHFPEHHADGANAANAEETQNNLEGRNERLIMEPAKCPYCTQPEFGVTYEPPPFRRGLAYAFPPSSLGALSTAMSSTSSINSSLSPPAMSPTRSNRKRAQSVSANAPGVVTADRIRPDWSGKLATALAHQRRRAAAADALHHAAFVMGNQESRTFFGRPSRFSRRATGSYRGAESPGSGTNAQDGADDTPPGHDSGASPLAVRGGGNRERIDAAHLESLMMAEAIRLSLADEEERRKKADKEARKEAKKREKEDRKAAKKKGEVYSGGGASASSLSLGFGRRRGDSGTGSLRVDASVAAATGSAAAQGSVPASPTDKGKGVERGISDDIQPTIAGPSSALPIPTPQVLRSSSHLRQMSNASSISSSGLDSMPASYAGKSRSVEDPYGSALSLGQNDQGDSAGSEPLFNFRSLAEVVGVSIDGEQSQTDGGTQSREVKSEDRDEAQGEHIEDALRSTTAETDAQGDCELKTDPIQTTGLTDSSRGKSPPGVVVTPDTPTPVDDDDVTKQIGHFGTKEGSREVTQ
ncbi:putative regulator protein Sip5 [Rosellinia necatrix]|uniref:Putative regulator protein Sip5 n=1 Tax=Rosellinia necatrix TaxID=77044 RepID=A0A1W2TXD0_ROSNE|nr:putative regulator protein Sip5 [Rosellinia necatrix]